MNQSTVEFWVIKKILQ